METTEKIIIYQVFTRLFGNQNKTCRPNGSLEENGCGKMNDFTKQALHEIKKLGATHIWYTGLIAHASQTDYTSYGIPKTIQRIDNIRRNNITTGVFVFKRDNKFLHNRKKFLMLIN